MPQAFPPRLLCALIATLACTGCAAFLAGRAEAPEVLAERVRQGSVSLEALRQEATPAGPSLRVGETGLAEVALGASADQVRARFGQPLRTHEGPEGLWWEFEELSPIPVAQLLAAGTALPDEQVQPDAWKHLAHVRVLLARRKEGEGAPRVIHLQAWAPGRFHTRTLLRPLDPADRVLRKYGKPARTVAWANTGGEAWLYPDANVAFVVTPDHPEQPRVVAGILVGITR